MAKHTFSSHLKHGILIDESNSDWIVTEDGSITVAVEGNQTTAVGMQDDDQISGSHIVMNGEITALGKYSTGINLQGQGSEVDVGKHATIHAHVGVFTTGMNSRIDNQGNVTGEYIGVGTKSDAEITNNGEIAAFDAIRAMTGNVKITNGVAGEAWSLSAAVNTEGTTTATVINKGLLSSSEWSIIDGDGKLHVTNSGDLFGDVSMGAGDDRFENRGGHIAGKVEGGLGDDVFKVDRATIFVHENVGEGDDTILTSSNYRLTETGEIETLKAVGKKNVSLEGDSGDTTLIGNGGDNKIHADDGKDYVRGGAGDDQLFGDGGDDMFAFSQGCDKDVIRDFVQGEDTIELDGFEGMTFMQLSNKISDTADGMLINLGQDDTILLKGFHDTLTVDDFLI